MRLRHAGVALTGLLALLMPLLAGAADGPAFTEAAAAAGLDFRHVNGAFGDKWMPETLGSGVAVLDADGDDRPDLLFVQGSPWPGHEEAVPANLRDATMRLYRNRGDGTFEDITAGSGLEVQLYGFGATAGDYDNDGRTDLYVTAYGGNRLFHNRGEGRFDDVTEAAGVGHDGWGTSAAWLDHDRDGDLDLYVANYVRWSPEEDIWCSLDGTHKAYCTPESYVGEPSVLYRNEGDGTFVDVTRDAGVYVPGGKSLGVTVSDFNDDGWPDIAVANDTEPNFLFQNRGDGTFEEVGLTSGVAFDSNGRARAGMGIDTADIGNDGRRALAVGNFSKEMIGLFTPVEGGVFVDSAGRLGIGRDSFSALTFALFFFDFDLDGWQDLFAVNGHLEDRIHEVESSITYAQPPLLFRNRAGERFERVEPAAAPPLGEALVGRGGAYADLDGDGDLEVVMTTNDGPARLLVNHARDGGAPPHVIRLQLRGADSNRDAIGARVTVRSGDWRQVQEVRSGSSYASSSELVLTYGLGAREAVDGVEIRWPSGRTESLDAASLEGAVDHRLRILEGEGVVEREPLAPASTGDVPAGTAREHAVPDVGDALAGGPDGP